MPKVSKTKKLPQTVILLVILTLGGILFFHQQKTALHTPPQSTKSLLNEYNKTIALISPLIQNKKYREAGNIASYTSPEKRTLVSALASYIGQRIYEQEGFAGAELCFSGVEYGITFGCVHGFLSKALQAKTPDYQAVVASCASLSTKDYRGVCFHNIGHALFANTTYDPSQLIPTFAICKKILPGGTDEETNCEAGVLMEHFWARMGADGKGVNGKIVRDTNLVFHPQKPYDVCGARGIPTSCWEMLPQWWINNAGQTPKQAAILCDAIGNAHQSDMCFTSLAKKQFDMTIVPLLTDNPMLGPLASSPCANLSNTYEYTFCLHRTFIPLAAQDIMRAIDANCGSIPSAYKKTCYQTHFELLATFGFEGSVTNVSHTME